MPWSNAFNRASRMTKRVGGILAVVAIVASILLWLNSMAKEAVSTGPTPARDRSGSSIPAQATESTDNRESSIVPTISALSDQQAAQSSKPSVSAASPVKVEIRGPNTVRAGDSFQLAVDVEALRGIKQITLTVKFDQRILQLVGSSAGPFVEQAGSAAKFGVDESCDGNTVQLNIDIAEGQSIAGAGSVATLEFRARETGASRVSVQDVIFSERGGAKPASTDAVRDTTIRVEPSS
jgi:Cohesin domain